MKLEKDILSKLYSDKATWERYSPLIEEDFFLSKVHKRVYLLLKTYWNNIYKGSEDTKLRDISSLKDIEIEDSNLSLAVDRILSYMEETEVTKETEALFKEALFQWKLRRVVAETIESLSSNSVDINKIYGQVEALVTLKTEEVEKEIFPQDCVEEILREEIAGTKFPTGLTQIDEQLEGGLWAGEIGLILGPSFRGKTWVLVFLGAVALSLGIPVMHFTLEISRRRVAIRYFQSLLEKTRKEIMNSSVDSSNEIRSRSLPPWSVKDYSSGAINTSQIDRDIKSFILKTGVTPLVIIDYGDLVDSTSKEGYGNEYIKLGKVIEELRRIANKYSTAIWTASQTNRPSYDKVLIGMSEVSDSIKKIQTADVIVTLNQTIEEHKNMLMRWYIDKARERELTEKEVRLRALGPIQKFKDLFDGVDSNEV